jgi:quinol monooxygenase YgiN
MDSTPTPPNSAAGIVLHKGLIVRLDAAFRRQDEVTQLLRSVVPMLRSEPATRVWYGLRFSRGEFGVFDAFADEAGREAHLNGAIARALVGAGALLESLPQIEKLRLLAHKPPGTHESAHKALWLSFPAREEHTDAVERFLRDAQSLANEEPGTLAWFAFQLANGDYGIFDVFPDNGARLAHLVGHVPRELVKHSATLLGGMPEMHLLDVIAERAH